MLSPWPRVFDFSFLSAIPNFGDRVRVLSIGDSSRYRATTLVICQFVANINHPNILHGTVLHSVVKTRAD